MTLDEAIKHAEKVAEENQRVVDTGILFDDITIDMFYCDDTEVIEEHLANYQRCAEEHRQIAEWLKELKQLRDQIKWIPVSERLPEKGESVLLTICANSSLYGFNENFVKVMCGSYSPCEDKRDWIVNEIRYYIDNVIAWMPLPEPYKTESEVSE